MLNNILKILHSVVDFLAKVEKNKKRCAIAPLTLAVHWEWHSPTHHDYWKFMSCCSMLFEPLACFSVGPSSFNRVSSGHAMPCHGFTCHARPCQKHAMPYFFRAMLCRNCCACHVKILLTGKWTLGVLVVLEYRACSRLFFLGKWLLDIFWWSTTGRASGCFFLEKMAWDFVRISALHLGAGFVSCRNVLCHAASTSFVLISSMLCRVITLHVHVSMPCRI